MQAPDTLRLARRTLYRSWPSPIITLSLIFANIGIFFAETLFWKGAILKAGAMMSANIIQQKQLWRLLTPVFLHASFSHLALNMLSLYNIGPQVESIFGADRCCIIYVASGVCGNIASCLLGPRSSISVGASAAILGLVSAMAVFLARHQELLGNTSEVELRAIARALLLNLVVGMYPGSKIDNWGHFGGVVGGAVMGYLIGPNIRQERRRYEYVLVDKPLVPLPWGIRRQA